MAAVEEHRAGLDRLRLHQMHHALHCVGSWYGRRLVDWTDEFKLCAVIRRGVERDMR